MRHRIRNHTIMECISVEQMGDVLTISNFNSDMMAIINQIVMDSYYDKRNKNGKHLLSKMPCHN